MSGVAGLYLGAPAWRFGAARAQAPGGGGVTATAALAVTATALGEKLHLLSAGGTNVVAHADSQGIVLVDGASAATAEALAAAVAKLPSAGPIHTLFNTHWHHDHTGMNERVGTAGAKIVAHENTRLWLTTDVTWPWDGQTFEPLPEVAQPNETFYEEGEMPAGVRYGYLRHAAHTDGDLYVYFPDEDVLAVGDAVSGEGWPLVDWWTGGWIGGIVGGLELVLALAGDATRIVPARGRVLTRSDIEVQYGMYNTVYERLSRLLNSGRGPDEAVASRPTEEFDAAMGPPDEFVRRAFESLWAYLSPDA